jgi:predicted PurR-regulated permease PerM
MVIAVAALYLGREVLVPFALALLLSFLLTPPVGWLEKLRLGRIPSALLIVGLALSISGAIGWFGMTQLAEIVTKIPQYQENLHRKIEAMRSPAGSALAQAVASIQQLTGEIASVDPRNEASPRGAKQPAHPSSAGARAPVEVEVMNRPPGLIASAGYLGLSLVRWLGFTAVVIVFTLFMLVQRADLRNRFIQLVGTGHLNVMTAALDDAAKGVSRYLLTQLIINGTFGLLLGLGLFWIGVPNARFWGILGALLRFIPYVGTLIAGLCPLALALAVFEGWARPLLTLGVFAGVELTMSAAIEPWLYGVHTGISSLAILVSTAFWTLLWGPVGLVLSTPLTVCLLVLGRYVPPLQFLSVLLGGKVELPPEARYYQRLLAMDEDEAQEIAESYLKERSVADLYDELLIPALSLAELDRHQNALDEEREKFIYRSTKLLIEDLAEQTATTDLGTARISQPSVICIPARDEADELVGLMLAQFLRQAGYNTEAITLGTTNEMLQILQQYQPNILIVSALPPFTLTHARSLCRKTRRQFPNLKIVLGLWGSTVEIERVQERLGPDCFNNVITSIGQAESLLAVSEFNTISD